VLRFLPLPLLIPLLGVLTALLTLDAAVIKVYEPGKDLLERQRAERHHQTP